MMPINFQCLHFKDYNDMSAKKIVKFEIHIVLNHESNESNEIEFNFY